MKRRQFIAGASGVLMSAATLRSRAAPSPRLRILILGGTQFIGVHLTQLALTRGHTITLFNRGRTNPGLFPQVEKLRGDRNGQLDALKGRSWDAVIDDSGYVPRHVRLSAGLLAPAVRQYLYISSISAYASFAHPNDEDSPLGTLPDESIEKVDGDTYGPLKALCEKAVRAALPGHATVIRPGFVVGPDDPTDRFTYWPARATRAGAMVVPGTPADPIQFIDVRDLARFCVDALEHGVTGTFNLVTPPGGVTMGELISACLTSAGRVAPADAHARPIWIPTEFLAKHDGAFPDDFPIWAPPSGDTAALARISDSRAMKAGLRITPLAQTVSDTLAWHLSRPREQRAQLKAGLTAMQEQQILSAWHQARALSTSAH